MSGACEYVPQTNGQLEHGEKLSERNLDMVRLAGVSVVTIVVAWLNLIPIEWLTNSIILLTVIVGGFPIFKESFMALSKGRINMELSMVLAIIASLFLLEFLPAIVITLFALLSEFLEEYIVQKGRKNIAMLYSRAPKKALLLRESTGDANQSGSETTFSSAREIPVEDLKIGDIVIIREGDNVPIDGSIIDGSSTIDQSTITGESLPIEKSVGDFVYAGTTNLSSRLEVRCEKISTQTAYAKIIRLVEESETNKAPIQKLSDKMATRLIQFAIGLSVLTFIVTQNLVTTLSVIVVAGACGLAVGTPIALLASNSKLAKNGVVVKGGIQIENISNAGTIVFDKTGTLAMGKPAVIQVISFSKDIPQNKILEYAAIVEKDVNHPLAKAIVEKAQIEQIKIEEQTAEDFKSGETIPKAIDTARSKENTIKMGRGVSVIYKSRRISAGNIKFIEEQFRNLYKMDDDLIDTKFSYFSSDRLSVKNPVNIDTDASPQLVLKNLNIDDANCEYIDNVTDKENIATVAEASSIVVIALDSEIIGAILLEDNLRDNAIEAITTIKSMGLHTVMLTGDNENIAKKIANEVGIEEFHANLLPEDKVTKIREIVKNQDVKRKKRTVIMVGDGINDAPALAESDVGIAMGKTGTDIVIETADVILMTENLTKIPHLIKTSQGTLFTIRQNFFGTLSVDGLGFILAFIGLLNPLLAAFIHVGSELLFMINSARLLKGN
ncbi:heavy metal translocating P-type ATPase [Candidatus Nitrosocosmicus arcticus]|uniref:K+-transporting ATPase, c chain n=1 Tax=Candidatus Nitrosocosmicus arcticus TaxID=2035267 RepID=A0A557SYX3_9ARCH|nr:cation-translocating P-type ATPase [Candidatus Nitrosocosmicus arcticus]TVP41807.1 K+-transporting ATPase, c chain [Candidatus Nitrosocosmicus arcticus]